MIVFGGSDAMRVWRLPSTRITAADFASATYSVSATRSNARPFGSART